MQDERLVFNRESLMLYFPLSEKRDVLDKSLTGRQITVILETSGETGLRWNLLQAPADCVCVLDRCQYGALKEILKTH